MLSPGWPTHQVTYRDLREGSSNRRPEATARDTVADCRGSWFHLVVTRYRPKRSPHDGTGQGRRSWPRKARRYQNTTVGNPRIQPTQLRDTNTHLV